MNGIIPEARQKVKYKAVIFDLDGTLIDTLDDIAESMNAVLRRHNFSVHPVLHYKDLVGWGIRNLVERTLPESAKNDEIITICTNEMLAEYSAHPVVKSRPYPDIPRLLSDLEKRAIPYAVFSNKTDSLTQVIVKAVLGDFNFKIVMGSLAEKPKKPDPTCAVEIARDLGYKPDQVLFLGDSSVDMDTARAAGMFPAGALWGFRTAGELTRHGAKALLNNPMELLDYLENNRVIS
ncbi:MAG: HAD family hydrolase [Spirochaetota bacterium]